MAEQTAEFLGVGPLAEALGVSKSLIRKLEGNGTLPPAPRLAGSGRRVYRPQDVAAYRRILDLRGNARRPRRRA